MENEFYFIFFCIFAESLDRQIVKDTEEKFDKWLMLSDAGDCVAYELKNQDNCEISTLAKTFLLKSKLNSLLIAVY